jgi:DNA polymerase-3 subunit alpha
VRYALAGIRNVGEKAMDAIVAEREANGRFASLEDLFRRAPPGSMNRRQLEGLACAGAFDSLDGNRAKVLVNADTLLAEADRSARERTSDQHSLLGGVEDEQALRLADASPWSRSDQMAKERENFGFYFAEHPVGQFRAIASANGARTYASIMASGVAGGGSGGGGGRQAAVMAAMIESVNRGKTRKGKDFVRADFSDSSGQFSAACFEETLVEPMLRWAADGTCVLLQVELDSPGVDEPPRVTVRGARPLSEVKDAARMMLTLDVYTIEAVQELAAMLTRDAPGRGEVKARLHLDGQAAPLMRLGRDFALDGELAEKLAEIAGIANVSLTAQRGGDHLRLVA